MVVVDSIKMDEIKTAVFRKFLDAVKVDGKAVVVTPAVDQTVVKSARNIPGVLTTPAAQLSVYDIINARYLVVDQAALAKSRRCTRNGNRIRYCYPPHHHRARHGRSRR